VLEFVVALDLQRVNLANEVKDMIVDIRVIINHTNDDCGARFDVNIIVVVIGAPLHSNFSFCHTVGAFSIVIRLESAWTWLAPSEALDVNFRLYSFNLSDSVVPLVTILDLWEFSSEKQFNLMDNIVDDSGCIALDALIFVATSCFPGNKSVSNSVLFVVNATSICKEGPDLNCKFFLSEK
ncbi:hypothetical protein HAX54_021125, partial [Datura stramonium]|nr:hypothetical protein [Datura stramonium]